MSQKTRRSSAVYASFEKIDSFHYQAIVHFYDDHRKQITQLDTAEYFALTTDFVNALYELNHFNRLLGVVEELIALCIVENIHYHRGEPVFEKLLLQKAVALLNTGQAQAAADIARQLIHIQPEEVLYQHVYKSALRTIRPTHIRYMRGVAVVLYLLSAFLVVVSILVVDTFYPHFLQTFERVRLGLFVMGILALVVSEGKHRLSTHFKCQAEVSKAQQKKRARQAEVPKY
jgi:hypothetical protein